MGPSDAELKIVSLVRYVDSCEPASRHRDCPYAVERDGRLTCREECRQVLASLLRRGRAPADPDRHAFDARQLLLSEPGFAPDTRWHTSSLLQVVVKVARTHPLLADGTFNLRRFVDATSALGALGCRGLDPEKVLRHGVAETVKLTISGWLEILELTDDPRRDGPQFTQWRAFFKENVEAPTSPGAYIEAALHGRCARRLDSWLETAPLDDVLRWKPPDRWSESPSSETREAEAEFWTWLVDRFTQTYPAQWSLESLKLEYRYLKGGWRPGLPAEILDERVLGREEIAAELAERALGGEDSIDPATMDSLTSQAAALLREGRREAAAALMDGARRLKPGDLDLQQNHAFCFLPDEPERAREVFKDVLARGIERPVVTLCNLALAETLLGNTDLALRACEKAYPATGVTAYLWTREGENWSVETTMAQTWLTRMGARLERSRNIADGPWQRRLANLEITGSRGSSADPSSAGRDGEDP